MWSQALEVGVYPTSPAFATTLYDPHEVAGRIDVLDSTGAVIASSADSDLQTLRASGGSVTIDRGASVRRRVSAELVDDGALVPDAAGDLFSTVAGNKLRPWRGLVLPDGTAELCPLGTFDLADTDVVDGKGGLRISLTGYDPARSVKRARFRVPHAIVSGTPTVEAIRALIVGGRPATQFIIASSSNSTTPAVTFDEQDDRWGAAQSIGSADGIEVYFNSLGLCVIADVPDPAVVAPAWRYAEGARCTVAELRRGASNERAYNHVVYTGENTGNAAPVRGEAWDANPTSPTYAGNPTANPPVPPGPYGLVTYFAASPLIGAAEQARRAAQGRLRGVLGATEVVSWQGLVNPAHDEGDVVTITRARSKLDDAFVLERFAVPLVGASMSAVTRERRL